MVLLFLGVLMAGLAAGCSLPEDGTAPDAVREASGTPLVERRTPGRLLAAPARSVLAEVLVDVPAATRADTPPEDELSHSTGVVPMAASDPVRLHIPAIGVDSSLLDLGLRPDGALEVPPGGFPAGWYTGAPTPGERGPAIIAGHVDWAGEPGVFFELRDLAPGDAIVVAREDGSSARFRVTRIERFAKDAFPTQAVYGDLDHAGLRLITCGGTFDRQARSYEDNIVVFAELTGSDAG